MKKKLVLLSILTACLGISAATYAASNTQSKEYVEANAAGEYNEKTSVQNGLFIKVTDPSTIQDGEELLLVGGSEKVRLQHIVGASYHYWMTTEYGGNVTSFGDYIYCNNTKGEMVTMEKNSDGSFYLKLKHFVVNTNNYGGVQSGYIVHEGYDNRGVTAFGDLYFRTKKDKPSQDASRWNITYTSNHIRIVSKTGRLLQWKQCGGYSWSSFIASTHTEWTSNVDLYRKVSPNNVSVSVTKVPTKNTYLMSDAIDLEGLELQATVYSGGKNNYCDFKYSDNSSLFQPLYLSGSEKAVHFSWCGFEGSYTVTINHDTSQEHLYRKLDSGPNELRGTYIMAATYQSGLSDYTAILDISTLNTTGGDADTELLESNDNPICDTYYNDADPSKDKKRSEVTDNVVTIECSPYAGNVDVDYVMRIGEKSLAIDVTSNPGNPNFGKMQLIDVDYSVNPSHIYTDSNSYIYIGYPIQRQIVFDMSSEKMTTAIQGDLSNTQIPVCLYKLELTKNLNFDEEIEGFRTTFATKTAAYDATAATKSVTKSDWQALATAYKALSIDAQSYIASITYSEHNHEKAGSLEQMVDVYDGILNTYYGIDGFSIQDGDFMRRNLANTYQSKRNVTFSCINCSIEGEKAEYKSAYNVTLVPAENYVCPETIKIYMGGEVLSPLKYSYNSDTGAISIYKDVITDDVEIVAEAAIATCTITYVGVDAEGKTKLITATAVLNSSFTLPTYADAGFSNVPVRQQFKCWSIDGVDRASGYSFTVTDDAIVSAVYEYANAYIREFESKTTTPFLSYDYTKEAEEFTFSNVTIRFRAIIGKALWDNLNSVSTIEHFGLLVATEDALSGRELKDLFDTKEGEGAGDKGEGIDNINVFKYESKKALPTFASAAAYSSILSEDSYLWNLRVYVPNTTAGLTTNYVSVAYIVMQNGDVVFLNQSTASVKSIAASMLATEAYDEESLGGSLYYLANLNNA